MKKFARICDITSEPMNYGWVLFDGEMYFKYKRDALRHVKNIGYKNLDDAFRNDAIYYTEWSEFDAEYLVDDDGNIHVI